MPDGHRLTVRFWGVRGSIATPEPDNLAYGGNTTCVEIRSADSLVVIDSGTGARNLGLALQSEFGNRSCSLAMLFTHFHWDHIQGLPFFAPAYSPKNEITFVSGRPPEQVEDFLGGQMSTPYFPVNFELLSAKRSFAGEWNGPLRYKGLEIHPFPMNHPQSATGYRLEYNGATIVHASDFEPGNAPLDRTLRDYAQDADVLIVDAQYTPEEFESKRGWGHSTWLEAAAIARDTRVQELVLFHHDPSHNDAMIDEIVARARRIFENTVAAREGWLTGA